MVAAVGVVGWPVGAVAQSEATPSNDTPTEVGERKDEKADDPAESSISTFQVLASEVGFGLGGATLGAAAGGLSGLVGGGSFVLFNPDVRTQQRAGRVLWGSVAVGAGIGVATGLPFGVFVGGDRLGADGKQSWATIGSLVGSGAVVATWALTWRQKRWAPARIAVLPLPLVLSITAFELSRPPDDSLADEAAPLFSRADGRQKEGGIRMLPVLSTVSPGAGQQAGNGWQIGIVGSF
jgi:hypothetical protein